MDIDPEISGFADDVADDRGAAHHPLPPAPALAGAEHDLGYLIVACEISDRLRRVRVDKLMPFGPEVAPQRPQRLEAGLVLYRDGVRSELCERR